MSVVDVDLRFFSLAATVRTDVPEVAGYARDLFGRFIDPGPRAGGVGYTLEIMRRLAGRWHVADGSIAANVSHESWLTGIVAARLLETVGNEVREHDLFHAAALERDGGGLLICGESGFGKSTLALALLDHGFRFLSDEVGVVGRDRTLWPFPKALELRPGNGRIPLPAGGTPGRSGKRLYDVETLLPGSLGGPCPLAAVIFLEPHEPAPPREAGTLRVTVHRRVEALPGALCRLAGMLWVEWVPDPGGFPTLGLRYDPERFAPAMLTDALAPHGVLVIASSAETPPPADFDREPALEPLPTHEGLRRLLGQFRGSHALPDRIEAHDGNFGALFVSMLSRLQRVRFARLRVGNLASTIAGVKSWHRTTVT